MTQYSTQTDAFLNTNRNIYEVVYVANGANGDIVSTTNPLPVSLGGEDVIITGNVSIPGSIEISNDEGNAIPTHTHLFDEDGVEYSNTNPFTIQILESGDLVGNTNALPTRQLNDDNLIAYARGAAVTETEVLSSYIIDKTGFTASLGTSPATMTTVWDGNPFEYPWNTFESTGNTVYVFSVSDDPKTRGQKVLIEGLDENYDLMTEIVDMNASNSATAVATTNTNWRRIYRATLVGNSTEFTPNDEDIKITYGSPSGDVVAKILAYYGKTQMCIYTVPRGYQAFIIEVNGSSGKDDEITSMIWVREFEQSWHLKKSFKFISGFYDHSFRTPMLFDEKSDVSIRAYALAESSAISVGFQMLILPKAV